MYQSPIRGHSRGSTILDWRTPSLISVNVFNMSTTLRSRRILSGLLAVFIPKVCIRRNGVISVVHLINWDNKWVCHLWTTKSTVKISGKKQRLSNVPPKARSLGKIPLVSGSVLCFYSTAWLSHWCLRLFCVMRIISCVVTYSPNQTTFDCFFLWYSTVLIKS